MSRALRSTVLCLALSLAACRHTSTTPAPPIAAQDLAKEIAGGKAPLILDVRTPAEYAAGHIPGAINIPHNELASRLADVPASKSTEIVVHCQAGGRAAAAEKFLVQEGYTNVRDLQGHFGGWVQQGLPVEPKKDS